MNNGKWILIVDDEKNIRKMLSEMLSGEGYFVTEASGGREALKALAERDFDIVLSDLIMPKMDGIKLLEKIKQSYPDIAVIILTGYGTTETAVKAMKIGAYDYLQKPVDFHQLKLMIKRIREKQSLSNESYYLRAQPTVPFRFQNIIGQSPQMLTVFEEIKSVCQTNATVLITGKSGTGKELIASAIHYSSLQSRKPFVKLNCVAIPEGLLESELFGHEKGAFTSAISRHKGKFERANGGTIFLDEIGDMPLMTQAKLLRILETRELERVGGTETINVDVRIVAATNQNLHKLVQEKRFRVDLLYRLDVVSIYLPPLRERKEDVPALVAHFIKKYSQKMNKSIRGLSEKTMNTLLAYHWPGNVRELENAIERAVIFAKSDEIKLTDFHKQFTINEHENIISGNGSLKKLVDNFEKNLLWEMLLESGGNKSLTAQRLAIHRNTLLSKLDKYGFTNMDGKISSSLH